MDLTDNNRTFHPNTAEYTFSSAAPGAFSKIDHIRKQSKCQQRRKIEITSYVLSDHKEIKLEINRRKERKFTDSGRLNSSVLDDE